MRHVRRAFYVLLGIAGVAAIWLGVELCYGIDNAYAQWGAAGMVIRYMEAHDGNWPPNWEVLREDFEGGGGRVGGWSFAEFQRRVVIDFTVDADKLREQSVQSETVPFRVIHARWTSAQIGGGPNSILHDYFRKRAGIIEAPIPDGGWPTRQQKAEADEWYQRGFFVKLDERRNVVSLWVHLQLKGRPNDADLAHVQGLTHLRKLNLVTKHVTDAGLVNLADLTALEDLNLGGATVSDAGLEHLRRLSALTTIDLFGTQITDAGLVHLRELPKLRSLRIDETKVTEQGVRDLLDARPGLELQKQGVLTVE